MRLADGDYGLNRRNRADRPMTSSDLTIDLKRALSIGSLVSVLAVSTPAFAQEESSETIETTTMTVPGTAATAMTFDVRGGLLIGVAGVLT